MHLVSRPAASPPPDIPPDLPRRGFSIPTLPAGTLTLHFSDIEESTRLVHLLGAEYAAVLADHRRLMRVAMTAHGGIEVGTEGDGFFAVFVRASDAVAAAADAQRALAAHPWPEGVEVRVRMGIHTGEPQLTDAGYTGMDVHRAARICAAGYGGQVLLSAATRALLQDGLPDALALRDLGESRLKGLPEPERLYQLNVAGLRTEFPALRTLLEPPHNLPVPSTPLLGREDEIAAVAGLLRGGARLVTLTGPGGAGKTRLAQAVAAAMLEESPAGTFFVPLAAVDDPALLITTIAHTIGVREQPGRDLGAVLRAHVAERSMLIVLDNFEQIVTAAPAVGELLAGCEGLRLIVTSRERLRLRGEREFTVPPLTSPTPERSLDARTLTRFAATRLFLERAEAADPGFRLTEENAGAVAEICRRLEGLPLAIELAAARVKVLPPATMLARLGRSLDLLRGGARDLPTRQQTLRGAIAWSYELLAEEERVLFRRLAVFAGGCTLESAEAICGEAGVADPLDGIAALLEKSLLRRDGEGDPRFRMLETIREFGIEALSSSGEEGVARRSHARHYLALAEELAPELTGRSQAASLDRLEAERDNLRSALHFLEEEDVEGALRMGGALWRFWLMRGYHGEGRRALDRLLALGRAAGSNSEAMVRVQTAAGIVTLEQGDPPAAVEILEDCVARLRERGDRQALATALGHLGWACMALARLVEARAWSEEALTLQRELGDRRGIAAALQNLAITSAGIGRFAETSSLLLQNLELRREMGELRGIAYALHLLAWTSGMEGHFDRSAAAAAEGLVAIRQVGDRQIQAALLTQMGVAELALRHFPAAAAALQEAVELWKSVGNRDTIGMGLLARGEALLQMGEAERGAALLDEASDYWDGMQGNMWHAHPLRSLGLLAYERGAHDRAAMYLRASSGFFERLGDERSLAACLVDLGLVEMARGENAAAADATARAQSLRDAAASRTAEGERQPIPSRPLPPR